jgi:uncharacterized protein (DUF342 family)/DNA-binding response OmpR family regulator
MKEKTKPGLILLESNKELSKRAESILSSEGWEVFCEHDSQAAVDRLKIREQPHIALFLCSFRLPDMEGDKILEQARSVSPFTQRMLMIPVEHTDMIINAINNAQIHACITIPFNDRDLAARARACFKRFRHVLKQQQLERITIHQNRQMFKAAKKLKKKDAVYKALIEKKKLEKLDLEKKLKILKGLTRPDPEYFKDRFIAEYKHIKHLFDRIADHYNITMPDFKPEEVLAMTPDPENSTTHISTDIINDIIGYTSAKAMEKAIMDLSEAEKLESVENDLFEILISKDQTKAYIRQIKQPGPDMPRPDLSYILDLMREKQISFGIVDDEAIEEWLENNPDEKFLIAAGEEPVPGTDGKVKYHFKTDFTNPGKINEDGTIDFRQRGDIPYVSCDDLLGEKIPPQHGKPGITVSGTPIAVQEVADPPFTSGPGTRLSEDGLEIRADTDGQPYLDAMGTISVNPELVIKADVNFKTGNIDFKGNIIVKGMVKQGFSVKGTSLTAREIDGAAIEVSGDLNISDGITNAEIKAQGHIYAKFINHSTIYGFKDLCVSKEIIDSTILLSGTCKNVSGRIISSKIAARQGIEAGSVGTDSSVPSRLKIGVDAHINHMIRQIDEKIQSQTDLAGSLKEQIRKLENQDKDIYQQISEKAYIQDRAQILIKETQNLNEINTLKKKAAKLEQELNAIFEIQDQIAGELQQANTHMANVNEKIKSLEEEKETLKQFLQTNSPLPVMTVAKTIIQDSVVQGPHASVIIKEDISRCRIHETALEEDDEIIGYEMKISDL